MARLTPASAKLNCLTLAPEEPACKPLIPLQCNFMQLLSNSPAAAKAYVAGEQALAQGQLTAKQRELLSLAVAEINGSNYCLSAHYAVGKKTGLTEEQIRFARKATSSDPQTDAMLRFAQAVTLQRGEISEADFQSLRRASFTDAQITEVIANIALNIFTNYFNLAVRTEIDFPVVKPGLDSPA